MVFYLKEIFNSNLVQTISGEIDAIGFSPRFIQIVLAVSLHHAWFNGADIPACCGVAVPRRATSVNVSIFFGNDKKRD